ncbi:MAG TPA: DUF167 domain-containing protein [Abditibacteriaceae bacterium]|jgi:hypothetical protein
MSSGLLSQHGDAVLIKVRVKPRARKNAVDGVRNETLLVSVTAAPEDGKASAAVMDVLSRALEHPKSLIAVARGQTSRDKTVRLSQASLESIRGRLEALPELH